MVDSSVSLATDWEESLQLPKCIFQFTESLSHMVLSCSRMTIYAGAQLWGRVKPC